MLERHNYIKRQGLYRPSGVVRGTLHGLKLRVESSGLMVEGEHRPEHHGLKGNSELPTPNVQRSLRTEGIRVVG